VKYTFAIRHNPSGEVRRYADSWDWDDEDTMQFAYSEGNYSCDCNRELFFARAIGEERGFDGLECGEEAYSIPFATRPDGTQVPIDDEADTPTDGGEHGSR
jgi:hypothetical protein